MLRNGLQQLGISDINKQDCCHLIGIATDGASVNIASGGLKGLVKEQVDILDVVHVTQAGIGY